MGVFSDIMDKIFHHPPVATASPPQGQARPQAAAGQAVGQAPSPPEASEVDVEAVLVSMAQMNGGGGNWRSSIVDLLKLLDLDSSLDARKRLAQELNVHGGPDGSAEQNVALHKAVMQKLADNGGLVPDSLRGR
jgi:hypothetical protein